MFIQIHDPIVISTTGDLNIMRNPDNRLAFGETIRSLRVTKKITLRKFAEQVGMSPTYLSKVERGEFTPPAEDKILVMARLLEQDPDELLALAGRVASDLPDIIRQRPRLMANFLRTVQELPNEEIESLTQDAQQRKSGLSLRQRVAEPLGTDHLIEVFK